MSDITSLIANIFQMEDSVARLTLEVIVQGAVDRKDVNGIVNLIVAAHDQAK